MFADAPVDAFAGLWAREDGFRLFRCGVFGFVGDLSAMAHDGVAHADDCPNSRRYGYGLACFTHHHSRVVKRGISFGISTAFCDLAFAVSRLASI